MRDSTFLEMGCARAMNLAACGREEVVGIAAVHAFGTYAHLPPAQWTERVLRGRLPILATTTLSAAVAGLGLAVLPHFLGRQNDLVCLQANLGIDPESGSLFIPTWRSRAGSAWAASFWSNWLARAALAAPAR